jgi:hypothetical protein
MSFKVKHENDKHFVVVHPDGSEFKIAKKGLDHGLIRKIQAYADGTGPGGASNDDGTTEDDNSSNHSEADASIDQAAVPQATPDNPPGSDPAQAIPVAANPQALVSAMTQPTAPVPGSVPFGPSRAPATAEKPVVDQLNDANALRRGGVEEEAQASAAGSRAEAKTLEAGAADLKASQENYQKQRAKAQEDVTNLEKDISSSKIDPNRFYSNMSTGSKITAVIGSILTGGRSLELLRDKVKEDIGSQLANLDTKKSLLRSNYEKLGDLNAALAVTQSQMLSGIKMQVQATAAKTNSPVILARKQQLLGDIDEKHAQLLNQVALIRSQLQATMGGVGVDQEDPRLLGNKDYAAKRVQVGNMAYQANTPKEAEDLRDSIAQTAGVKGILSQLDAIGPSASFSSKTKEGQTAESLANQLIPKLNRLHKLNRLSAEDVAILKKQFSDPTEFQNLMTRGVKNNVLLNNIQNNLEDDLKAKIPRYKGSVKSRLGNKATSGFTR